MDGPQIVTIAVPTRRRERIEPILLSVLCRILVWAGSLDRALRLLDRLPTTRAPQQPVTTPPETSFRGAGACLARTLARSEYLRRRGAHSVVAIGARTHNRAFDAHAWLEPLDNHDDHTVVHRILR